MTEPINLGISGGRFGERHAKAFQSIEGVELVAIAEPDESLRNRIADTYGFKSRFDSHDELVFSRLVDAIVIATPSHLHSRHVCAALDADLHVLSEQPPATSASDMSKVATTAGLVGKVYMWSHPQRFSDEILKARDKVASGELGDIYHAYARWQWGWWPFEKDGWRSSSEDGGGALLDVGIQAIDSVWFAMGCPDAMEAFASSHNHFMKDHRSDKDDIAEDSSFGMARFKNGATLTYEAAYFSHLEGKRNNWGSPEALELRLLGTKGSVDLVIGSSAVITADHVSQSDHYAAAASEEELFERQAQEFVSAIRENREPMNDAKQALKLMKIIDGLNESAKEKRAVSIKAERSLEDLFGGV